MSATVEPGSPLQTRLDQMVEAGRREGILPDSPLGQWQEAIRLLTGEFDREVKAVVSEARAAAQASAAMADAASRKAESSVRHAEIRTDQVLAKTVEQMMPAVIEGLEGALVIRERRWNRRTNLSAVAAIAAALLGIFAAGWITRGVQEGPAADLLQRCLRAPVQDAAGNSYCNITALRDRVAPGNVGRGQ